MDSLPAKNFWIVIIDSKNSNCLKSDSYANYINCHHCAENLIWLETEQQQKIPQMCKTNSFEKIPSSGAGSSSTSVTRFRMTTLKIIFLYSITSVLYSDMLTYEIWAVIKNHLQFNKCSDVDALDVSMSNRVNRNNRTRRVREDH